MTDTNTCGAVRPRALGDVAVTCSRPAGHDGWCEHGAIRWTADVAATGAHPMGLAGFLNAMGEPPPPSPINWICIACGLEHPPDHEGFYLGSFMACVSCEKTVVGRMLSAAARAARDTHDGYVALPITVIAELQIMGELDVRGYLPARYRHMVEAEQAAKGLVDDGREESRHYGEADRDYNAGYQDALAAADKSRSDMVAFYENALKAERATAEEHREKALQLPQVQQALRDTARELAALVLADEQPIPIQLNCPRCHEPHIDEGDFATKPHHTHACQSCGLVWKPSKHATVGVRFLPGYKNEVSS